MKPGKGIFLMGADCQECDKRIEPGTKDHPAYWAYERDRYGDRVYYHRSCARKVTKRRVANRQQWEDEYQAAKKRA